MNQLQMQLARKSSLSIKGEHISLSALEQFELEFLLTLCFYLLFYIIQQLPSFYFFQEENWHIFPAATQFAKNYVILQVQQLDSTSLIVHNNQ